MTIFARRSIQSFLTALRGTLTPHQLAALVDRLNLEDLDSLATEWEICILFALMNLGRIIYAPAFTGKSRPDVHFLASDDTDLQFIADVTLISDSDLEKNNPILELTQIISARARKLGIPGTFSFTVGSTSAGRHGAQFEEENGFAPSGKGPLSNPFENALRRGLTISATKLEPVSDRDDDWIEFRITGPDPALAPFHSPGQAPE
jgi:hypothetical protein